MSALPWTEVETAWHAEGVRSEPFDDAVSRLTAIADEVEATKSRVRLTREGRADLVLLPADELESLEETLFWCEVALERAAKGEPLDDDEGPVLDEAQVRAMFGHLLGRKPSAT